MMIMTMIMMRATSETMARSRHVHIFIRRMRIESDDGALSRQQIFLSKLDQKYTWLKIFS